MKRLLATVVLIVAAATLSGCYYDPGYSYVRGSGYAGDAYYGDGGSGYYATPGYYDGYYGGYYGCCYAPGVSVGVSSVWYGGSRYRHDGDHYRDHRDHRDYRDHAGQWQGHGGDRGEHRGDRRGDRRDDNTRRRDRYDRDDRR